MDKLGKMEAKLEQQELTLRQYCRLQGQLEVLVAIQSRFMDASGVICIPADVWEAFKSPYAGKRLD